MSDPQLPAFPLPLSHEGIGCAPEYSEEPGITKLEYFAARAPTEIPQWFKSLFNDNYSGTNVEETMFFEWRYYYARKLLERCSEGGGLADALK